MKILYRVYHIVQSEMIERVDLPSVDSFLRNAMGVDSAHKGTILDVRYHMKDFDSEEEAVQFISNPNLMVYEEYEIVKIYKT